MSDDTTSDDVERVERTDLGASVEARLKRGTGTRDEDQITIKAKGETASDALEKFEQLLAEYEVEYSDRMRAIQPTGEDEGDRA
ncbi:DUF7389 domain-containing protein [Haloarcula nitratireducens]|uniref:DUF7389 domain-containing protein n=1 Tax=Haloarcula nitratireducens TaxID=2487749 RepID=A0AAW4PJ51_9EURY|nr:hypothetical protein [Halomicroarcula nitratireducens]MBX0297787.1 hypothetical protein [Halomicroarcula nitratireducens]